MDWQLFSPLGGAIMGLLVVLAVLALGLLAGRLLSWPRALALTLGTPTVASGIWLTADLLLTCFGGEESGRWEGWSSLVFFSVPGALVAIGGSLALLVALSPAVIGRERSLLRWAGGLMVVPAVGGLWVFAGPALTFLLLGNLQTRWR